MSKVDKILDDELDPEDLDPTPRGGKNGRDNEPKKTGKFAAAALAVLLLSSGCKVPGQPEHRPPAPPVQASCDEPAAWCHRSDAAEAVQR